MPVNISCFGVVVSFYQQVPALDQGSEVLENQKCCLKLVKVDVSHLRMQQCTSYHFLQKGFPYPNSDALVNTIIYNVTCTSGVPTKSCCWDHETDIVLNQERRLANHFCEQPMHSSPRGTMIICCHKQQNSLIAITVAPCCSFRTVWRYNIHLGLDRPTLEAGWVKHHPWVFHPLERIGTPLFQGDCETQLGQVQYQLEHVEYSPPLHPGHNNGVVYINKDSYTLIT